VPPSNYIRMAGLYSRIANVLVSPFKLKAASLDIDIMLTLMNVSESDEQPLYLAAVTQILRQWLLTVVRSTTPAFERS
jgi:hypothetical protein